MPVLKTYLLSNDFYMLAENLPRVGITNVVAERERRNATRVGYQHSHAAGGEPVLPDIPGRRLRLHRLQGAGAGQDRLRW
jgi:hypothetical protein